MGIQFSPDGPSTAAVMYPTAFVPADMLFLVGWHWTGRTTRTRHPTKRRNRKHAMRTARLRGY